MAPVPGLQMVAAGVEQVFNLKVAVDQPLVELVLDEPLQIASILFQPIWPSVAAHD